jgi:hypothetical protein
MMVMATALALPAAMAGACGSETDNVISDQPTAGTGGSHAGGAGGQGANTGGTGNVGNTGGGGWGQGGFVPYPCQGHIYQCGDNIDNDGDGLTDWQDPDCLGPCDNTEDSYYGGIPGQAGPPCQVDCYFDQDSGSGNDQCYWDHVCDPLDVAPNYYPEPVNGSTCEYAGPDHLINPIHQTCDTLLHANGQLPACLAYCLPLTPNGCDCFGCCELPAGSGDFVWLGSTGLNDDTVCTDDQLSNPAVCHPCTPVTDCYNGCAHCEICIGKPTLPPDCLQDGGAGGAGGGPGPQCPSGIQPCGQPGQEPCGADQYCITGCCQDIPA